MRFSRLAVLSSILFATSGALAEPILPGPGAPGHDPALLGLASAYQRQQDVFATLENGLSLDTIVKPDEVATVQGFFAQAATDDFQQVSGKHPYEVVAEFGEHGDEGNFAGIASVGVAARLITLRAQGAPSAEIAKARAAAVRAARAWHVYGAIGGPGVVARGVRRVSPWAPTDPPFPGMTPALTPLEDGAGKPLPEPKSGVWRAPVASGFDGWIWMDDTSKDQVSGYALAAAWLWDALHDDPEAPSDVSAALAADLAAFARTLMKVAPELDIDLCIRDGDGRLTSFHDLNARQVVPDAVLPEDSTLRNGFNAVMALGIVRAAYHVSGDPEIGKYYYEDLVGKRDYPRLAAESPGFIYVGAATNYSNVNMLAISLALLGRFETDPYVRQQFLVALEKQFWDAGSERDASHVKQAWFDAIYGAYEGAPAAGLRARITENLGGFPAPPAFERDRVNCDEAELAAKKCLAIDGVTTIEILSTPGHGGGPVAKDILPMSIRPDSDFHWRSDPHQPNGNASTLMDPGGDFLAAYWLSRASELGGADKNVSPFARPPVPYTLGGAGGGDGTGGAGAGGSAMQPPEPGGCDSCQNRIGGRSALSSAEGTGALLAVALLAARRTRKKRAMIRAHGQSPPRP
ncbi:MAG: hypothetical protein U0359_34500 [Byssovorax sp.]